MTERFTVDDLLYLMQRLRDPKDGCPWDRQQTLASIVPFTLEECYELAETIETGDLPHLKEELGDVLFQVIFYSQLTAEDGLFDFGDVVHTLVDKLVRRHPHVFPTGELQSRVGEVVLETAEIKKNWEAIKQQERKQRNENGLLADIPNAFPALVRAQKIQKRAASVGFDWGRHSQVVEKIHEEMAELDAAITNKDDMNKAEEAGDLLFAVVNLVRHLNLDAETVLRAATGKFSTRFTQIEQLAETKGSSLAEMTSAEMEQLWRQAKVSELL